MFRNTQTLLAIVCTAATWFAVDPADAQSTGRQPGRYAARTQAQYGFGQINSPAASGAQGYVPQHLRQSQGPAIQPVSYQSEVEMVADGMMPDGIVGQAIGGEVYSEPMIMDPMSDSVYGEMGGYFEGEGGYFEEGCDSCGVDSCDSGMCGTCKECIWTRMGGIFSNADYNIGVQGFKNPLNRDQDGSFGFHGGVNLGMPLSRLSCGLFSGQFGINSVQSNLAGSSFTDQGRNQLFVTGGIFRRVDQGLQGGIVYDYLQDDWYANVEVSQLRGELSWVYESENTFGFRFSHGLATYRGNSILLDDAGNQTILSETWRANDTYRFFYRKMVAGGEGYIDFSAGYTEEDQTLFGLNFNTPVRGMMRFYGGFTYLLPEENILSANNSEETWNVMMGLQFSPYKRRGYCRYNVPMFDVADNGSFQVFPNR